MVNWRLALSSAGQGFLHVLKYPARLALTGLHLGLLLTKEVVSFGGEFRHQVVEERHPGPLLQLAELVRLVAGGLSVDEFVKEPLPELRTSPEDWGTGEAGTKVRAAVTVVGTAVTIVGVVVTIVRAVVTVVRVAVTIAGQL